jgi:hypothetical protein
MLTGWSALANPSAGFHIPGVLDLTPEFVASLVRRLFDSVEEDSATAIPERQTGGRRRYSRSLDPRWWALVPVNGGHTSRSQATGGAWVASPPRPARWVSVNRELEAGTLTRTLEACMIWLAVILLVAWLLGWGVFHVAGGLIHLLLVLALVVFLINFISGRRTV